MESLRFCIFQSLIFSLILFCIISLRASAHVGLIGDDPAVRIAVLRIRAGVLVFQIIQEQLKPLFRHMLHHHDMGKLPAEPVVMV